MSTILINFITALVMLIESIPTTTEEVVVKTPTPTKALTVYNSDVTAYYYTDKEGVLYGGSGRELIPGYSVGCLVKHHKEMYGKIITLDGIPGIAADRHFRVDDSGYGGGSDEFLIDYYAGTGEQYLEYLTDEWLIVGRYKNVTVTVIGYWDGEKEVLYAS